jgi:hypothetical protein
MKTSNKLVLGAFLFFLASLVVYNGRLKAAYSTGAYKDLFFGYKLSGLGF